MTCCKRPLFINGKCYHCGASAPSLGLSMCIVCGRDGELTPSMTQYEWDGTGVNPNGDLMLCPEHAIQHTEQMQTQWDEYRNMML